MKPKAKPRTHEQPLIATMRLDLALDMDHELVRLAGVNPWDALAGEFGFSTAPKMAGPRSPSG